MALGFGEAFSYPFNRAKGMLNILWALLPIFGWFALGGYGVRIVREFSRGKFEQLPEMKFVEDMKLGFSMFLKAIPFAFFCTVVIVLVYSFFSVVLGLDVGQQSADIVYPIIVCNILEILFLPILAVNFIIKGTVRSFFEFRVVKAVFSNFGDYVMTVLKSFLLIFIFLLMTVILVGLPALSFTKNIFLVDFYRRNVSR